MTNSPLIDKWQGKLTDTRRRYWECHAVMDSGLPHKVHRHYAKLARQYAMAIGHYTRCIENWSV